MVDQRFPRRAAVSLHERPARFRFPGLVVAATGALLLGTAWIAEQSPLWSIGAGWGGPSVSMAAEPQPALGLSNPGFELGDNEEAGAPIPGWVAFSLPEKMRRTSEAARSGKYSLRMEDDSNQAGTGLRSEPVAVQPGETYDAEVWALVKQGTAQLYLEFWDAKGTRIDVAFTGVNAGPQWTPIRISRQAPAGAVTATVLLYGHKSNVGLAYYDDVSLQPASAAQQTSQPLRLASLPGADALRPPLPQWGARPQAAEIIRQGFTARVTGHPRLLFTPPELPALRAKASNRDNAFKIDFQEALDGLQRTAQGYAAESSFTVTYYGDHRIAYPLPPRQPEPQPNPPGFVAGRYPYWTGMAGQIKARLETLAIAYALTGEPQYARRAKEYLLALTTWERWSDPTYDCGGQTCLDTGYIVEGVAVAYDVLWAQLSEAERVQVRQALVAKGLQPLFADTDRKIDHNIHMVRTAALGLGALAVLGEEPGADRYIARAFENFFWYLDQRLDSRQTEGMLYTNVSMNHIVAFADALERVTGNRSMFEHPWVRDVLPRWVIYFLGPAGSGLVNFSDSSIAAYFFTTMAAIGRINQNPQANWYIAASRAGDPAGRLLYLDPRAPVAPPDDWPSSAVFADIGWVALRSGWGAGDTLLAFQSSGSRLGHNHFDQNHFVLNVAGQWLIKDPGYQDYNPGPKNQMTNHTLGHNAVLVNGRGQTTKGGGQLVAAFTSSSLDYVAGDATRAYAGTALHGWARHILYVKPDYFVLLDEMLLEKPSDVPELLIHPDGLMFVEGDPALPGFEKSARHFEIRKGTSAVAGHLVWPNQNSISVRVTPGAEEYGPFLAIRPEVDGRRVYAVAVLDPYTSTEVAQASGTYPAGTLLPALEDSGRRVILTADGVFFRAEQPGDRLTLRLSVPRDGRYRLGVRLSTASGYGRVAIHLDGQPVGNEIDTYAESLGTTGMIPLGEVPLTAGDHTLSFTVTGKHPQASQHFISIEAVELVAVDAPAPTAARAGHGATVTAVEKTDGGLHLQVAGPDGIDHLWLAFDAARMSHRLVRVAPTGDIVRYAIMGGSSLTFAGRPLLSSDDELSAAVSQGEDGLWSAEITAGKDGIVKLWLPKAPVVIVRDGTPLTPPTAAAETGGHWVSLPVAAGSNHYEITL